MPTTIKNATKKDEQLNKIFLLSYEDKIDDLPLSPGEKDFVLNQRLGLKKDLVVVNRYLENTYVVFVNEADKDNKRLEFCRRQGAKICTNANTNGVKSLFLMVHEGMTDESLALAEGIALANYQFIKYRKDKNDKSNSLESILLSGKGVDKAKLNLLNIRIEATLWARDLVNEPLNKLNAEDLADAIGTKVRQAGGKAEVFNKKKIQALKMGGLLAVNRGSIDPPTFTILEWKPENAVNEKPIVLVGKGVVYDTGGLSLKPSSAMDTMKCDMAGAAAVAASIYAVTKAELPLHVVALVPATDNRPDGNAYVPGDIISMFDGTSVEVLNTDAEGRMILADALAYAKKFDPELVCNFATLTGSAVRAIGSQGIVAMEVKADGPFSQLKKSGKAVHERLVKFPMWESYKDQLKSEIADLKNIGGPEAGAITAAKFLEHFTDYPFIHFDIAGPAFIDKRDGYRSQGGTGVGVRLMFDFLQKRAAKK